MKHLFLLLLAFFGIAGMTIAQKPTDKRLAGLDTFVNKVLKDWHAPGVGIAIIEKNKVVYVGGFGFSDYENKTPVSANTLFAIGSCTKAFTGALLGKLQADGKLDFDEKVTTYLPDLRFYNDELTKNVTVRDLTCHRTGLPRHDLSWYLNPTTRDSLVKRIQYMEPSAGLREAWQYNNFMFLLQGVIAEKLSGKPWEENVREQLFKPLGMTKSNFALWANQYMDEAKGYYADKNDVIKGMDYYKIEGMGPAGSIFSTPTEMANWVMTWVNGGKYNGQQVIPEAYVREAMSSQMVIGAALPTKENPDLFLANYGMGWFISSYRGHYLVQHGGNIDGFSANVAFYPTDSIGIVVLTNQNGSTVPSIVRNHIADKLLKLPYKNWSKQVKDAVEKAKAAAKEAEGTKSDSLSRKSGTQPSHALAAYAGSYENPGYGAIQVYWRNDTLYASAGETKMRLNHYHYDVFQPVFLKEGLFDPDEESPFRLQFKTDINGNITSFAFVGIQEGLKEDIVFERQTPAVEISKDDLQKYLGEYAMGNVAARVYVRHDGALMILVPGQPDYETTPIGNHEFKLKALDGYSIRFEMEGDKAIAVYFIQPNGTFKAMKK